MKKTLFILSIIIISCVDTSSYDHESPELLCVDSLISIIDMNTDVNVESEDSLVSIIDSLHKIPKNNTINIKQKNSGSIIINTSEPEIIVIRDTIRDTVPIIQEPEIIIIRDTIIDTLYLNKKLLKKVN